jgi:hypothetical protein
MAESDRRRGQSDGARQEYNPPDGKGFLDILSQQIFGESEANQDYERGHEEGRKQRG